MSAHEPGEVLVRLTLKQARHLHERTTPGGTMRIPRDLNADIHELLSTTLAGHDAAQNPLGTPWVVGRNTRTWWVMTKEKQQCLTNTGLTEAQARLMAASPELADALEEIADYTCPTGGDLRQKVDAVLRKAGRR